MAGWHNSTRVFQHRINMPGQLKRHAMTASRPTVAFVSPASGIYIFSPTCVFPRHPFFLIPRCFPLLLFLKISIIHTRLFFTTSASCHYRKLGPFHRSILLILRRLLSRTPFLSKCVIYDRLSVCVLVIKFELSYD